MLDMLKDLAPLGAVILFGWGVYQYYRSNELGFRKPFWEKLLTIYIEATTCAANLARTEDSDEWRKARDAFWKLYYGPLCLVEDQAVESAMVEIGLLLESASFEDRVKNRKGLETAALNLAYACRNSIRTDWKIPMETLSGRKRGHV